MVRVRLVRSWVVEILQPGFHLHPENLSDGLEAELEALADFPLERIGQKSVTAQIKDEQRMFAFA
jgi:hypothetical protein